MARKRKSASKAFPVKVMKTPCCPVVKPAHAATGRGFVKHS